MPWRKEPTKSRSRAEGPEPGNRQITPLSSGSFAALRLSGHFYETNPGQKPGKCECFQPNPSESNPKKLLQMERTAHLPEKLQVQ
jgi:hypothetical protein